MKTRLLALAEALWLMVSGPDARASGTAIPEDPVGASVNPFPLHVSANNRFPVNGTTASTMGCCGRSAQGDPDGLGLSFQKRVLETASSREGLVDTAAGRLPLTELVMGGAHADHRLHLKISVTAFPAQP